MVNDATDERIYVFTEEHHSMTAGGRTRPLMWAIPHSQINTISSQWGSQNCYLVVNGLTVRGSFDELVSQMGVRVDIN